MITLIREAGMYVIVLLPFQPHVLEPPTLLYHIFFHQSERRLPDYPRGNLVQQWELFKKNSKQVYKH